jgi:probable addiction module antidote protein
VPASGILTIFGELDSCSPSKNGPPQGIPHVTRCAHLATHALGVIARAKGMTQIGRAAGLGRESLYKALSAQGNPEFATVLKVIHALGLKLKVAA